jgi:hypothetical protein
MEGQSLSRDEAIVAIVAFVGKRVRVSVGAPWGLAATFAGKLRSGEHLDTIYEPDAEGESEPIIWYYAIDGDEDRAGFYVQEEKLEGGSQDERSLVLFCGEVDIELELEDD